MMKRTLYVASLAVVSAGIVAALSCAPRRPAPAKAGEAAAVEPIYLSPIAVVADKAGKTLYVAEHTGCRVAVVDVATGKVTRRLPLPGRATGLALSPDGSELHATAGVGDGRLVTFDTAGGKLQGILDAGHSPTAPVAARNGTRYVCDRFGNAVLAFAKGGARPLSIPVSRQPVALALGQGGRTLVVANHLPAGRSDRGDTSAAVTLIDTATNKVVTSLPLPNGSTVVRGVAVSPDGKLACVTFILARYMLPVTQIERGWLNTNVLAIVDVPGRKLLGTVLLDEPDRGAANPWAAAWTPDGKHICVSHAGTHEISVVDWVGLSKKLAAARAAGKGPDPQNDLSFLDGLRRRIALPGNGPRGLAVVGSTVYAAMTFSDSLCVVDVDPAAKTAPRTIRLGPVRPLSKARKGEMLFNDATLSFQEWVSCASCHPDGRSDALVRDLLSDGMGNSKSTKSLIFAHRTPPALITGIWSSAEVAVRGKMRFVLFSRRPEEDATCIDEYLKNLKPVPSPYLIRQPDGTLALSESAKRGKAVFDTAGCAECHHGPHLTDMKPHDVGTGVRREKGRKLDTPTLREVWRTGPFLHDGRAATMEEVFTTFNPKDLHGKTSKLTRRQLADLCRYVLSL